MTSTLTLAFPEWDVLDTDDLDLDFDLSRAGRP